MVAYALPFSYLHLSSTTHRNETRGSTPLPPPSGGKGLLCPNNTHTHSDNKSCCCSFKVYNLAKFENCNGVFKQENSSRIFLCALWWPRWTSCCCVKGEVQMIASLCQSSCKHEGVLLMVHSDDQAAAAALDVAQCNLAA